MAGLATLTTLSVADVALFAGLVGAAVTDFRTGKIPNVLTFPMMAIGIASWAATGPDRWFGLVGCLAAFALHYVLFAVQVEKAGDAKLMMGLGACVGWREMVEATLWWAVLFIPVGLILLAATGKLPNLVAATRYTLARLRGPVDGPAPAPTHLRVGPILLVAGALAWSTDWLGRFV
jgi:Flp pilus assembly protein protease CpaA